MYLQMRAGCIGYILGFATLLVLFLVFGDYEEESALTIEQQNRITEPASQVVSTPVPSSAQVIAVSQEAISTPNVPPTAAVVAGPSYEEICGASRSNLTEPQMEMHVRSFEGLSFSNWNGWVYDVVSSSNGYNLEVAMEKRGLFWSRDIVIENIPSDLAIRLNVEQPILFSGHIPRIETTFGVACNPMIVDTLVLDGQAIIPPGQAAISSDALPPLLPRGDSSTLSSTSTPTPVVVRIGEYAITGILRWRVISSQDLGNTIPSDNQFVEPAKTSGRFVKVKFEVENRSGGPGSLPDVVLVDSQGRTYQPYDRRLYFLEDSEECFSFDTLNPNLPKICAEIFEVASDATGYKLRVSNDDFVSPIEAIIEL
jgi:hypothetical protein